MTKKQMYITNLIIHSMVIILGAIAIIMQLNMHTVVNQVSYGGWHTFRFFTNDGNIFCMIVSLINIIYILLYFIKKKDDYPKWLYLLNLMSSVNGLLIFFTVLLILWPTMGPSLFVGYIMVVLHVINPILVTISFLFTMHKHIKKKEGLLGMVPMALYGIPVLILILSKVWTDYLIPYPFLKVYDNPWWSSLLIISTMFLSCALVGILLSRLTKIFNLENANKKKLIISLTVLAFIIFMIFILVLILNIMY